MSQRARDREADALWSTEGEEAEALLELARVVPPADAVAERRAEQRFLAAFRRESTARERRSGFRHWPRVAAFGVALSGAALAAVLIFRLGAALHTQESLSYRVSDEKNAVGTQIEASHGASAVEFSDGTEVTVEPGARAQILETTSRGAHFRLQDGRIAFDVVPHAERGNWSVDAGPFQVRVTGTAFTVEWNAAAAFFQVQVSRGHVIVEGEGQRRELGAGDTFRHGSEPSARASEPASPSTPEHDLAFHGPAASVPAAPSAAPPHEPSTTPSWARLVAAGQFQAVIEAAEQRGEPTCLATCSTDDLQAWADAARLLGKASLAERVLLSQRARFVGSPEGKAAAFLLGRLAEGRRTSRALDWYGTYLAESPNGRFASDALGREMVLSAAIERARAVPLARQYLDRFPSGPYASHARSIIAATGNDR